MICAKIKSMFTDPLALWMVASLSVSILGIVYAVYCGTACDGGRGGALGVAIAFGALFISGESLRHYIEAPDEEGEPAFDSLDPDERIRNLRNALAVLVDRQHRQAAYLTIASVGSTIVWGFGDIIAGWFGAAAC